MNKEMDKYMNKKLNELMNEWMNYGGADQQKGGIIYWVLLRTDRVQGLNE